ncbi:MAG: hypothetical protein ACREU3_07445, partial [Steroidobacteraceae bacterium]
MRRLLSIAFAAALTLGLAEVPAAAFGHPAAAARPLSAGAARPPSAGAMGPPSPRAFPQPPGFDSAVVSTACDYRCLVGFTRRYMDALAHHDPSRVPFARHVKFTENDVVMPIGAGLW